MERKGWPFSHREWEGTEIPNVGTVVGWDAATPGRFLCRTSTGRFVNYDLPDYADRKKEKPGWTPCHRYDVGDVIQGVDGETYVAVDPEIVRLRPRPKLAWWLVYGIILGTLFAVAVAFSFN